MIDKVTTSGPTIITPTDGPTDKTNTPTPKPTYYGAGDFTPPGGSGAASLGMMPPQMPNLGDMMAMVIALKMTIEDTSMKTGREQAETIKDDKLRVAQERLDALQEMRDKQGKAEKGGLMGDIFGWLASAAMIIAGAILVATGVGGAAGVALLAAGITMAVMTTLNSQALGKAVGLEGSMMNTMIEKLAEALPGDPEKNKLIASAIIVGVITAVAVVGGTIAGGPLLGVALATQTMGAFFTPENMQAMGVSEDAAPWASMGVTIGLSLVGILSGVGATKLASSAAEMSGKGATMAAGLAGRAAHAAANTADAAANTASTAARMSAYVSVGIGATATVGQGGSQIYTAVKTSEAENLRADVKDMDAFFLQLQQMFQDQADKLQEIVDRMSENMSAVMSILNQMSATDKRINAI
jgi:hypothetical protein